MIKGDDLCVVLDVNGRDIKVLLSGGRVGWIFDGYLEIVK